MKVELNRSKFCIVDWTYRIFFQRELVWEENINQFVWLNITGANEMKQYSIYINSHYIEKTVLWCNVLTIGHKNQKTFQVLN